MRKKVKRSAIPHLALVDDLMKSLSRYSKIAKRRVTGNAVIEPPVATKEPPTVIMFFCNEAGAYMVWFADQGKLHLYSNQSGKSERIISVLASQVDILQEEVDKLKPLLNPDKEIR